MKQLKHTLLKALAVSMMCGALAACGGGGGGSDTSTGGGNGSGGGNGTGGGNGNGGTVIPAFVVTVQSAPTTLTENGSEKIVLDVAGAQGTIRVTDEYLSSAIAPVTGSYDIANNVITYTLNTGEAKYRTENAVVEFVVSDNSRSYTFKRTFNIDNTSGTKLRSQLSAMNSNLPDFVAMKQEIALFDNLSNLVELIGDNATEVQALAAQMEAFRSESELPAALKEWTLFASSVLKEYDDESAPEADLAQTVGMLPERLTPVVAPTNALLDSMIALTGGVVPSLPIGNVFISDTGELSQFVGNAELGQYVEDHWVFNDDFGFVSVATAPETCSAE